MGDPHQQQEKKPPQLAAARVEHKSLHVEDQSGVDIRTTGINPKPACMLFQIFSLEKNLRTGNGELKNRELICYFPAFTCCCKNFSTLPTYTLAKSTTGRRVSINCIASAIFQLNEHKIASVIMGARCTPAAQ